MGYIKLDKKALFYNLDLISLKAGSKDRVAIVLKDNAYGHGLLEMAKLAKEYGLKRCVVRNIDEAKKVKELFDYILVLSELPKDRVDFHIAVNSLEDLVKIPCSSKIHLKIDTGMHRNGIEIKDIKRAFELILKKDLFLKGVFTHFRSADELSSELFWQDRKFEEVKEIVRNLCKSYNLKTPLFHSCNSAALFRFKKIKDDFARVGIAAYGCLEMDEVFNPPRLKPVLSLWAKKISSRVLKKGQRIGYSGVFEAEKDIKVSTYDIGYADGIFRSLKSTKEGDILGRVSMDSISVESEREEIAIFDNAKEIAKSLGTISYEVLVKLSPFLKRVIK